MPIRIAPGLELPDDVVTQAIAILARLDDLLDQHRGGVGLAGAAGR